jgi:hypothetical protein
MELRVPRGIYGRRVFWLTIVLSAAVLFSIRYFLVPKLRGDAILQAGDLLDQVLEDMLAAVLVAGVLTALLSYFAPEPQMENAVEVVPADDRGPRLKQARAETRIWWFSGAMGRFTRTETLPAMAAACREDGRARSVVLQVIDPRDVELCGRYANLRSSLRSAKKTPWSAEHVQQQVVATVIAAYAIAGQQNQLDLQVALRSTLSQQRYDVSDSVAIVTTEDDRRAALAYPVGSPFYDVIRDDLRLSLAQAHVLPSVSAGPHELDLERLDIMLSLLGLNVIPFTSEAKRSILDLVHDPTHPYA